MWDRKKLKEIAKEKFQANYWKCVLVALLFSFIMGGASGGFSGGGNSFGDSLKKSGSAFPAYNNIKDSSDSGYDDEEDLFDEDDPDDAKVKAAYDSELGKDVRGAIKDANDVKVEAIKVRDLTLDQEACTLKRGDRTIELTSVEYKIMELFMTHPGKVFTKQQIYEHGWGDEYIVADNNIMVCISKLRSKLDEDPSAYIKTMRGLGYRLEQ